MIPEYINNCVTVIEEMSNDNTYKLAWGRAINEVIKYMATSVETIVELFMKG